MRSFLVSFGVIFAAEMGDKSQLMALAFAGGPTAWIRSGYGWTVIAKSVFAIAMLLGALACRFKHVRLMERGDVLAGDALHRSSGRQFLFALLVLYATAELAAADLPAVAAR